MPTTTETRVNDLIINKMSKAQFDALQEKSPTELYIVEGDSNAIYAEQITALPTAAEGNLGKVYQYIGATDANYTQNYFYKCVSSGSPAVYSWQQVDVQPAGDSFQYDVMPEASAANKDHIVQYTGETTADYQNGYFYKCIEFDSAVDGAGTIIFYNWDDTEIPEELTFSFNKTTFNTYAATLQTDEAKPLVSPYLVINLNYDDDGYPLLEVIYNGESEEYVEGESYLVSPADKTVEPWELLNGAQLNGLFASIGFTTNFTDELAEDFSSVQLTLQSVLAYNWINEFVQETFPNISEFKYTASNLGAVLKTDGSSIYWEPSLIPRPKANKNYLNNLYVKSVDASGNFSLGWDEGTVRNRSSVYAGSLAIGDRNTTLAYGPYRTAIGIGTEVNAAQGLAIGYNATISGGAQYAILLGNAPQNQRISNGDANTFKVYNGTGTYEMMSANGTIPEARLADMTNASQGQVLTLDSNNNAVWATPSSGGGVPTLTWYTISTAGTTLTIADTSSAQLVKIYKNGLLLQPTEDYTISGTTLTTVSAMVVGDKITTEVF